MDRQVFRVAMDLVGVCGLLAARHYAGVGEALVHSYLGNVSASCRPAVVSRARESAPRQCGTGSCSPRVVSAHA